MITVTARAAAKAVQLAHSEQRPAVLRLGVRGGGCSGLSYFYDFDGEAPRDGDHLWAVGELQLRCDPKSMGFLRGCELDYDPHMLKGGFRFTNPQAKRSCSCGESFSV